MVYITIERKLVPASEFGTPKKSATVFPASAKVFRAPGRPPFFLPVQSREGEHIPVSGRCFDPWDHSRDRRSESTCPPLSNIQEGPEWTNRIPSAPLQSPPHPVDAQRACQNRQDCP